MEKIINDYINKGKEEGLTKDDYIELKNLFISTNNQEYKLKIDILLNLIYNAGILNKLSEENVNYILNNSYLLPLVLANNEQDKIRINGIDSYKFMCPFHDGHKPKFSVTNHSNYGHCFKCNTNVSQVSYLKKIENINYIDAVDLLAYIFLFDIKYENKNVIELTSKYQESVKSDTYLRFLEAGLIREINKYGASSNILERYNLILKNINRIKNNEYDSNFEVKTENKKLVLTDDMIKNTLLVNIK